MSHVSSRMYAFVYMVIQTCQSYSQIFMSHSTYAVILGQAFGLRVLQVEHILCSETKLTYRWTAKELIVFQSWGNVKC